MSSKTTELFHHYRQKHSTTQPPPHSRYSRLFHPHDDNPFEQPSDELLIKLGSFGGIMEDHDFGSQGDCKARTTGVTFLGQFISHDVTFDESRNFDETSNPENIINFRNPTLGLDTLYGDGGEHNSVLFNEKDPDLFKIGTNDKSKDNDLPRRDKVAQMGDPRNDDTLIMSQMHLAFLKFHNAVVKYVRENNLAARGKVFEKAKQIVQWHYQWIVLHYYLPQIVDKKTIQDVLVNGRKYYHDANPISIPIEFSLAAYRFGHSIVKPHYVINDDFGGGIFNELNGKKPVKEKEVVQWKFFFWLDPAQPPQLGRKIDTKIASPFFNLPFVPEKEPHLKSLLVRSFLRGKYFGLPSGEYVAKRMNIKPLTQEQLGLKQLGFNESPLYYYILREAEIQTNGERLGQMGGRIVAEVLIGLLQQDSQSFMVQSPEWKPFLKSAIPGQFSFEDLLRFAGVDNNKADAYHDRDTKKRDKRIKKLRKKYKNQKVYDPSQAGRWDVLSYDSKIEAVHLSLLPTGKVLYLSGFRVAEAVQTEASLWNPLDGNILKPSMIGDMFCSGHCQLPDGRLLITGGTMEYRNLPPVPPKLVRLIRPLSPLIIKLFGKLQKHPLSFSGPSHLYIFNSFKENFEFAGDMIGGRWYPTNTVLPDGRVLILSGTDEAGGIGHSNVYAKINRRIELFDLEKGIIHVGDIPHFSGNENHDHHHHNHNGKEKGASDDHDTIRMDAEGNTQHVHDHGGILTSEGPDDKTFPSVYPRVFVLPVSEDEKKKYPKGKVFCAGYGPDTKMLNLASWEWEQTGTLYNSGIRWDGCAVLLALKPPYYNARILHFGGSMEKGFDSKALCTVEIIDFSESVPTWKEANSCHESRVNGGAVLLPDGRVVAVGGNSTGKFDDPVHKCEIFDPRTNTFEYVAEQLIARGYHSTAILLPDGRVLSSGTTPFGRYELGMEVYYPDYCFKGPRPVITDVEKAISYSKSFKVHYEFSWDIAKAVLVAPGSMTHAFDMNQRLVELQMETDDGHMLTLEAPPNGNIAPPGYYMLFIISSDGVPSVSKFIKLML